MDPEEYADKQYCNSLVTRHRFATRVVKVGDVCIGGKHPLVLQSMTTTDTMDTYKTVGQSIRMIEAGCQLIRITAPSKNDAENLAVIRQELHNRGFQTPLVADIHFTPNAAEIAARIVEKVRVNPGNYADKKKFEQIDFTREAYDAELKRIRSRFEPLVRICKEKGTAMRIGTNHGSLSDRIMSFYGDTPLGMVESAMEFIRICRDMDFHDIVLSMKASNPQIMIQAYRLLVARMKKEHMNYPLHLGVTEAGDGEDGRIKSAVGIGALLEDGLGDTIRVSLTEDPEFEIPVARILAQRYEHSEGVTFASPLPEEEAWDLFHPFSYERRETAATANIGAHHVPVVVADFSTRDTITPASLFAVGYHYNVQDDKWNLSDQACDYIYTGALPVTFEIPGSLGIIQNYSDWKENRLRQRHYPLLSVADYMQCETLHPELNFVRASLAEMNEELLQRLRENKTIVIVLRADSQHRVAEMRMAFLWMLKNNVRTPVVLQTRFSGNGEEAFMIHTATDAGALLVDGIGDGIWISSVSGISPQASNRTAFGILQATRTRISKTEYIACPSCGRTLFDLQETTQKIRARTHHLKGIKIGIMGCIVNGPGEMADADYGYVGTGPGKISLYKGKEVIKKNVQAESAVEELIELIRENGDWIDSPS